jgi:mono/diheme cytochrome c family protein
MRRFWVGSLVAVGTLTLLAAGGTYGGSAWVLRRTHDDVVADPAPRRATDPAEIAEGRRFAILVGCLEGCHGPSGTEGYVLEEPGLFAVEGPPLGTVLPAYSDDELVRLLRRGVKRDGTTALFMPAGTFHPIGDADLARLIGYLRTGIAPADSTRPRRRELSPQMRAALALGRVPTSVASVDTTVPRWGNLPRATPFERGRYLASIICSECHGLRLEGNEFEGSPALTVVAGYSRDQFGHLLRTGRPPSGRDLGLMGMVARDAFVHFRDDEIDDLYAYLQGRLDAAE